MAPSDLGEDPREQVGRGARLVLSRHPWCGVNAAPEGGQNVLQEPHVRGGQESFPKMVAIHCDHESLSMA